jgi:cyclophilin family peptidyl-prolyl cis-trans isomerase
MIRFATSSLVLFSLSMGVAWGDVPQPTQTPANTAAVSDFQKLVDEWNAVQAELAKQQLKLSSGDEKAMAELKPRFVELLGKLDAMQPKLRDAAEKEYTADEKNKAAGDLLFAMSVGYLRRDNDEEALRLAKLLIDHNYANKEVCRVAASAALALTQLDDAKKYVAMIADTAAPKKPPLEPMLAEIAVYGPKWEREKKLRDAEAKADDLPRVKLHTTAGDMVVELFENEAPNTVANFVSLVEKGFYNGTAFHRVLPNFVAQGGDPISIDPSKHEGHTVGNGGPGYFIPCECYTPNHREHFRGSLSMAHAGKDTGGSQFFLTFCPTAGLDGKHTVFGRVIDGMDVLSKIQRIDPDHIHGIEPDKIISAEVVRKRDHPYVPKVLAPG